MPITLNKEMEKAGHEIYIGQPLAPASVYLIVKTACLINGELIWAQKHR